MALFSMWQLKNRKHVNCIIAKWKDFLEKDRSLVKHKGIELRQRQANEHDRRKVHESDHYAANSLSTNTNKSMQMPQLLKHYLDVHYNLYTMQPQASYVLKKFFKNQKRNERSQKSFHKPYKCARAYT